MPSARLDIISIGTLSRNRLWNETAAVRTPHATTTLIRVDGKKKTRNILIDPALPPPALAARLNERTGLAPAAIDTIFLTNFRPAHRGGISLFPHATILIHEIEQQAARAELESLLRDAPEQDLDAAHLRKELELLERAKAVEDKVAEGVDLFPLFGYTPGTSGLLVTTTMTTTLVAGDAVPTLDHFLAGQVLPDAADIAAAQESMGEVYEIADLIVPGHDNLFLNPRMTGV